MKVNKWTLGLAALGLVSLPAGTQAEEKMNSVWTALSSTTISGYVDTSGIWNTSFPLSGSKLTESGPPNFGSLLERRTRQCRGASR